MLSGMREITQATGKVLVLAKEASKYARELSKNGLQLYHNHSFEYQKFDGITE